MYDYSTLSKVDAQKKFNDFPEIDAAALTKQVNELFTPYLFFHLERDKISFWSSCCGEHSSLNKLPRTMGPVERSIIYGKHNSEATCPCCGRRVTMKNVSRLGKRKNLVEYHPVVFLKAKDGDLYARCCWARKDYQDKLNAMPLFMDTYAMRFSIGRSEEYHDYYDNKVAHSVLEGNYDPVHRVITEPFAKGGYWMGMSYVPYTVYGLDEIAKSDFKYCQYEEFEKRTDGIHYDLCKYLAACSIYPRQIEMLMKTGCRELVEDLVCGRRKNRNIIKWTATNPCEAFNLDKVELRAFHESGCSVRLIEWYKKLRRYKLPTSFETLREIDRCLDASDVTDICVRRNIRPDRLTRYLDRFVGPRCGGMGVYTIGCAYQDWKDYLVMAEKLHYDLTVETVLMPRNLDLAHQQAQEEMYLKQKREERRKNKAERKAAKESLARRQKRYNVEHDGYFIRIAVSSSEITREGKMLDHCVGGYAERHMSDKTTILFLRSSDAPDTPLYTVQMDGDFLVQIHGYRNERLDHGKKAPDPRETMRWFLDPWLEWVKKGSPRRKDGTPRLPKFKEVKTA